MGEHSGPTHDATCLNLHASDATCRCRRRDWLRESVPRHQARAELLTQLANWAHEQRVFASAEIDRSPEKRRGGVPGWVAAAVRAAAQMAEEVYVGVRRRALAMRKECDAAAERPAGPRPVETVHVQEALL